MAWKYNNDDPDLGIKRLLGSDQAFANATGGTAAAINTLSFPIKAGETFQFALRLITTGVSGGGKVSISGPASPSLLTMTTRGLTSGVTAFSTDTVTALDTLGAAYNTSAVTGLIEVLGVISAIADGTVSFNAANVTNSNSFAILKGSTLVATKVRG
jgi:hypothetical protein